MKKILLIAALLLLTVMSPAHADFTETWADANSWFPVTPSSIASPRITMYTNDGLMGTNFARFNSFSTDTTPNNQGVLLLNDKYFKPGYPCSISFKVRAHVDGTPGSYNIIWFAAYFYTDECNYIGGSWLPPTGYPEQWNNRHQNTNEYGAEAYWEDVVYNVVETYDGNTTVNFSVNGTAIPAANLLTPFNTPFTLYLAGTSWASAPHNAHLDVGQITFTGTFYDYAEEGRAFLNWTGNCASEVGQENFSDNFHTYGGGLTARVTTTGNVKNDKNSSPAAYLSGNFNGSSPVITPPSGKAFGTLSLYGSARGGGTLKVYVRDGFGNLVSDSQLPGNSTGLSIIGWPVTYNLSSVTAGSIYFDAEGSNPGVTSPVILQALTLDYGDYSAPAIVQGTGKPRIYYNTAGHPMIFRRLIGGTWK